MDFIDIFQVKLFKFLVKKEKQIIDAFMNGIIVVLLLISTILLYKIFFM